MKLWKLLSPAAAAATILMSGPASALDKVTFRMNWYYGGCTCPVPARPAARLLQGRGHRPHPERGPRLGQHGAGRRRRLGRFRRRRFLQRDAARGQGRRDQVDHDDPRHQRLRHHLARRDRHQDAEGPRGQAHGDQRRRRADATLPGLRQDHRHRPQQDLAGADRSGRQGGGPAGETRRRHHRRPRRPVFPGQAEGCAPGRHAASPTTAPTPSA